MGHVIRNLLALQEVDLQILSINGEKVSLLNSINEKRSQLEKQRGEFEEQEARLKQEKVDMRSLEVELAESSTHVRKLESQQVHIKTNQEYKALDREIYEAKIHQTRVEDQLLEKMEFVEQENIQIRETSRELDARAPELQQETSGIEEKISQIERTIEELQTKRSEVSREIDEAALKRYERILTGKSAPVLVPVVNGACQGCHLVVTAAVESVLRRGEADIITCENCSRILYIPDEEPE